MKSGCKNCDSQSPTIPDGLLDQALRHYAKGDFAAADRSCEKIGLKDPRRAEADHLRGLIAHRLGDSRAALGLIRQAIARDGRRPVWYANLGSVLRALGRYDEALQALAQALALDPSDAGTANNVGCLLEDLGRFQEALDWYRRALESDPDDPQIHYNLGNVNRRLGQVRDAMIGYRQALKRAPGFVDAYVNLGNLLLHQGMAPEAIVIYRQGLTHIPEDHRLLSNLAAAYIMQGHLTQGAACLRRAISRKPDYAAAHNNLASVFQHQGRIDEALASYRHSLALEPADHKNHSNLLFALHYDPQQTPLGLRQAAEDYWTCHRPASPVSPPRRSDNGQRRLRVGYVSADFREHSVSYFFAPLLGAHDRCRFEVFCYAAVRRRDKITAVIEQTGEHWRDILVLDATQAAALIRRDGIDILIDLGGHTAANRLDLFTLQPAPVQMTWLGYPGTTGLATIAYRITDAATDPVGMAESHYTERLLRLPETFICYGPPPMAPDVLAPPCGRHGPVTFGSFNNLAKTNPAVVAAWAAILHRVPGSRLLLKDKPLADAATCQRIIGLFADRGIEADRLEMLPRTPTTADHLECYQKVDIALDPFPYNGTTTTCEALWMGVPVVTWCGTRHSARVGAAILAQLGLNALVAKDPAGYVEMAVDLAKDRRRLGQLRAGLRRCMGQSTLCDAVRFSRRFEAALLDAWNRSGAEMGFT